MPYPMAACRGKSASGLAALTGPSNPSLLDTSLGSGVGTTIAATMPAQVGVGNEVSVGFAMTAATGDVTCADDRGNTYTMVEDENNTGDVRLVVFRCRLTTQLEAADSITVTFPADPDARAVGAYSVANVKASSPVDTSASAQGASDTPSSGNITTSIGGCMLMGWLASKETNPVDIGTSGFTPGSGWTEGANAVSAGSTTTITLVFEYRAAAAALTDAADGTWLYDATPDSREYAAAVYALKGL